MRIIEDFRPIFGANDKECIEKIAKEKKIDLGSETVDWYLDNNKLTVDGVTITYQTSEEAKLKRDKIIEEFKTKD